jgi:hypothetical protein
MKHLFEFCSKSKENVTYLTPSEVHAWQFKNNSINRIQAEDLENRALRRV